MPSHYSASQIQQQIVQDTSSCETLLSLLNEEREALKSRDMDALERILREKSTHLESLEHSSDERKAMAIQYQQQGKSDNWNQIIEELHNENIRSAWEKLKELLKLCKLENQVNGKLLARNHQVYSRLLELVCGQSAAPNVYNASGSSPSSGSSNIVGEA